MIDVIGSCLWSLAAISFYGSIGLLGALVLQYPFVSTGFVLLYAGIGYIICKVLLPYSLLSVIAAMPFLIIVIFVGYIAVSCMIVTDIKAVKDYKRSNSSAANCNWLKVYCMAVKAAWADFRSDFKRA